MLYILSFSAVQIEHSTWQHRVVLQLCVAHCLGNLSTLRCDVGKLLCTTNEMAFPVLHKLWGGSVHPNALCSADDAKKTETTAIRRFGMCVGRCVCVSWSKSKVASTVLNNNQGQSYTKII